MLTFKRVLAMTSGLAGSFLVAMAPAVAQAPPASVSPQGTNDPHAEAVELLRKIIKEQQQHPDRIIRTPPPAAATAATSATASVAPAAARLDRGELERQFLDGKISAKQFQRAIEAMEKNPPPAAAPPSTAGKSSPKDPAVSPRSAAAIPPKGITNQPVTVAPSPEEAPEQKALSDVEAKIDEILSRRQAQIQAAKTNAASTNGVPAGPLTKRQKLDGLLRDLIQGKITEAEYNTQREKVMAQPD